MFYVNDEPESKFPYTETIKLYCIVLCCMQIGMCRSLFLFSANSAISSAESYSSQTLLGWVGLELSRMTFFIVSYLSQCDSVTVNISVTLSVTVSLVLDPNLQTFESYRHIFPIDYITHVLKEAIFI